MKSLRTSAVRGAVFSATVLILGAGLLVAQEQPPAGSPPSHDDGTLNAVHDLQEQVPVHISFGELGNTWVTVVNISNGNAMRGQLTLLAHIILNSIRVAEQAVMDSGMVGRVRKRRE